MKSIRSARSLVVVTWLAIAVFATYLLAVLVNSHREQEDAARQRAGELTRLIAEHASARFQQ